jgi:hypothetical protein
VLPSIYNNLRSSACGYFLRRFTAGHALRDDQLARFYANLGQISGEKRRAYDRADTAYRQRPLCPNVIR